MLVLTHSNAEKAMALCTRPMTKQIPPNTWKAILTSLGTGSMMVNRNVNPEKVQCLGLHCSPTVPVTQKPFSTSGGQTQSTSIYELKLKVPEVFKNVNL